MVPRKKTTRSAAAPVLPLSPPTPATVQLPEAAVVPAKLPACKRASAQQPAVKKLVLQEPIRPEKAAAPEKIKKPKLVRDSFTIPKTEYAVLDELKQRAALLSRPAKKSEVLRAGIKLLATLPDAQLLAALAEVAALKSDRPVLER